MARIMQNNNSDSEEDEIIAAAAAVIILAAQVPLRSCWVREWVGRRETHGAYATIVQELMNEDPQAYKQFVRMRYEHFRELEVLVDPLIRRQDTVMRQSIKPGERLAVTLRYLGSGSTFADLSPIFRIPARSIRDIVLDTCDALYTALADDYLKVPSTPGEWRAIARGFEERWNFPNCIGAMDGKHIQIKDPGGSMHRNYLGYHSIVLLALVDDKYRFLYVDVGTNGKAGDAGVFRETSLASALQNNTLHMPEPTPLPGRTKPIPFFIVGDDAFPLKPYLMKPYPFNKVMNNLHDPAEEEERRRQRIFDYRLSRARRISENAFGILASRFRVFQTSMLLSPENATRVTLAALAVHNFLMTKRDQAFAPPSLPDREHPQSGEVIPGQWRDEPNLLDELRRQRVNRSGDAAREVREEIKKYVNEEGQVPWQEGLVFRRTARV